MSHSSSLLTLFNLSSTKQLFKTICLLFLTIQLNVFLPHRFNLGYLVYAQSLNTSKTVTEVGNKNATSNVNGYKSDKRTNPQVILPQGIVQGFTQSVKSVKVNVFLGIPYADPPIGDQRFRPSQVISKVSNETILATEYGPNCWEPPLGPLADLRRSGNLMVRSEDCLYLNIWAPENASMDKPLPVFVYVHGGVLVMYSAGDSRWTDGRSLAALGNIIVVTLNYRLGTLGFLFSGNSDVPGNLGLTDQLTALKWVKKHISAFGGDPNKITLYGLSSGALTVSMLFLSGQVNDLITGLVVDSGGPSALWADSPEKSLARFQVIASKVGCYIRGTKVDTAEIVDCLKSKPALLLTTAGLDPENIAVTGPGRPEPFFPTLGSDLFPQNSIAELYQAHLWKPNISVLIWLVTDEGFAPATYGQFPKLMNPTTSGCSQHLINTRNTLLPPSSNSSSMTKIGDLIKTYCKGYENAPMSAMLSNFNTFLGDWYITCPSYYFADILAEDGQNQVYFGKFTYYNNSFLQKLSPDFTGGLYGARHGLDKIYLMGLPYTRPDDFSETDRGQSFQMITIYSQFVRNGNPGWTPYQITSKGRIIPFLREVNSLKDIKFTAINQDRVKCFVWNDILYKN
ncbi:cholinesterase 2 [Tetranychus urticae]|uniref:Carboxylic ester hydrolase n=1 Tax=Tetranychus urticae TaxID=32264 RepID=T1JYG7_TETUR|nr:cholinesterase 2 [Tetranychus urticae]